MIIKQNNFFIKNYFEGTDGQMMLITMLLISGLIFTSSALAGLLVFYQIRQAVNSASSSQAILAADAAVEAALYCYYKSSSLILSDFSDDELDICENQATGFLKNKSKYSAEMSFLWNGGDLPKGFRITATGIFGNTTRFWENDFYTQ